MHFLNKKINQAIITWREGNRLKDITKDIPKPLYPIDGTSTLERAVKVLHDQGISKFIFFINFVPDLFEEVSKEIVKKFNITINIIKENNPKGEAGSIFDCIELLEDFLFVHGDVIFDIDLMRFKNFHFNKRSDITIMTHLSSHPEDSDCIIESPSLSIAKYKFKNVICNDKSFFLAMLESQYFLKTL